MSYKEDLLNLIDQYFKEISEKYRITTLDAMTDARKVSILKKRDFLGHAAKFQVHKDSIVGIDPSEIVVPESDEDMINLKNKFEISYILFNELCDSNIKFYQAMDRKQNKKIVSMSEYKKTCVAMQKATMDASKALSELDKEYQEYISKN